MPYSSSSSYAAKAAFFDSQVEADWAAKMYGPEEQKKIKRLFSVTGSLRGLRILEPGCGTGRLTAVLARKVGARGSVTAMDISPKMIAAAKSRLATHKNVKVLLGAIEEKLPSLGGFDQVICHQVFPHFADYRYALKMLTQALVPNGLVVISHFIPLDKINDVHRKAGTAVADDMMPEEYAMRDLLQECGLGIEKWWDDAEGYLLSARRIP